MSFISGALGGVGAIKDDPRAMDAITRWQELKGNRSQHEADWEDIARLIRPQRGGFRTTSERNQPHDKPLSSAPIVAQGNLSAGLYGTLMNESNRWFGLKGADPDLNRYKPMAEWLDIVTQRCANSFSASVSPFYNAGIQLFSDITAFGNAAQYDELLPGEKKIMDVTLSLAEVVYDIDGFGMVNEVVRRFGLKARAAARMLGTQNLPPKVNEMADKGSQEQIWFLHHVLPNDDFVKGRLGPRGKKWLSHYLCEIDCAMVRVRGYDDMPFLAPRWEVESGCIYGTGPGFVALASARLVNLMDAATIKAAQFAADPTKLAASKDMWQPQGVVRPGAVIQGGLDYQGRPTLRNMETHPNIGLTIQEKQQKIEEVRDAFNWSLMNLAGRTGMTATEVMTIQEERQRLMAPHMGRIQHEYLAPKIARRFALLWKAGQLPPPPPEAEGMSLQVEYLSAAAMAQRSMEGTAVVRILEDLAPLAQMDPRYLDRLSPDDIAEALHAARGAPASILRSREEADAIAQGRAQAQQAAQQMEMAAQSGAIAKDMASAAQQAGMVPQEGAVQ